MRECEGDGGDSGDSTGTWAWVRRGRRKLTKTLALVPDMWNLIFLNLDFQEGGSLAEVLGYPVPCGRKTPDTRGVNRSLDTTVLRDLEHPPQARQEMGNMGTACANMPTKA